MKERWKIIPGFEKLYWVSTLGRIYSQRTKQFLSLPLTTVGYADAHLWVSGKCKHLLVHRAVLMAFVGLPVGDRRHALHLNHDKTDNRLSNLKWGTPAENMQMDWKEGRRKPYSHWTGKLSPKSKTIQQFDLSGTLIREWNNSFEVEKATGLRARNIRGCCTGDTNTAYGFIWKYKKTA